MKQKAIAVLTALTTVLLMLALVVEPRVAMNALVDGLNVWAQNVLPATFPYLVLCSILLGTGAVGAVGRLLSPATRLLWRTSGLGGYAFLAGAVSGYPVGARILCDLYASRAIDRDEVRRSAAFCATSGPTFVLGTVAGMLGATKPAVILLLSHLVGAIVNGLLYRGLGGRPPRTRHCTPSLPSHDAVWRGVQSMLTVGGYIAMFSVVLALCERFGLLTPLYAAVNGLCSALGLPQGFGAACVKGAVELTTGCKALSVYFAAAPRATTVMLTVLTSAGGACIGLQCTHYLSQCGVSRRLYGLQKLSQAVLSGLICAAACALIGL